MMSMATTCRAWLGTGDGFLFFGMCFHGLKNTYPCLSGINKCTFQDHRWLNRLVNRAQWGFIWFYEPIIVSHRAIETCSAGDGLWVPECPGSQKPRSKQRGIAVTVWSDVVGVTFSHLEIDVGCL